MYNNCVSLSVSDYRQNVLILLSKADYEDSQDYRTLSREKEMADLEDRKPTSIQAEVHRLQIKTQVPQTEIAVFVMGKKRWNQLFCTSIITGWTSDTSSFEDTMEKII
uniref:DDE_Tnp_1_7 domain-containing protein n=1 Tax=Bursaphelenchus xylophilus TaxID=6326 RepID=A0A1I7RSR4_BURXY